VSLSRSLICSPSHDTSPLLFPLPLLARSDYLRIGDYITLKTLKFDGFIFADGILQESFCVEEASQIQAFEEALFCVHYPRQYSAARELEEFNEANLAGAHDALDEEITKKYLTALKV
jgi:hypothetical protein